MNLLGHVKKVHPMEIVDIFEQVNIRSSFKPCLQVKVIYFN